MRRLVLGAMILMSGGISTVLGAEVLDCCGVIEDHLGVISQLNAVEAMPQLAEQAPLLFVGRVVKAETSPCCDRLAEVTLRVGKAWKGPGQTTLVVHTGAAADRPFPFGIAQEYLVAALGTPDRKGRFALFPAFTPVEVSSAKRQIQALDEWRLAKTATEVRK